MVFGFSTKTGVGETERRIRANDWEFNSTFPYANNYIKTSKYSVLTFVPHNLVEQFRRLANFYFLCLLVLQLIPLISSLTPITTALPLIGVLSLTALKDAFDDYQRHRSDRQVNSRRSLVLRRRHDNASGDPSAGTNDGRGDDRSGDGYLTQQAWAALRVGDVVRLECDQSVSADLLLLSTSEPNGLCFVETAELDGETNLKCRQALTDTAALQQDEAKLAHFDGEIVCEPPNNNLNKFEGTLTWNEQHYSLDNDNLLLRGCVLRNTSWCYGVVVFAGRDTKLMQNTGRTLFKRTSIDRLLNYIILGIVLFLVLMCLFCTIAGGIWETVTGQYFRVYLPWNVLVPNDAGGGATVIALLLFFSYAIVLNTLVPISLYVSVEVIRLVHSFLINWDVHMYDEQTDTPARARTTTLNEELGQIQYIFSDKTGTLTQNIMSFNKCSIGGRLYGEYFDPTLGEYRTPTEDTDTVDFSSNPMHTSEFRFYDAALLTAVQRGDQQVHEFFRLLALCHTVMAQTKNGQLTYQAQSPDEDALVSAARNFGFVFVTRTPHSITVQCTPSSTTTNTKENSIGGGETEVYELLCILDFNNVRKRMSVVVRRHGEITLYCKGADSVVLARAAACTDARLRAATELHLEQFAAEGLRTLLLASRRIDPEYFADWRGRFHDASVSMHERQQRVERLYEELEQDLQLIGVTAVEDKLQDGVPETIANLSLAGIKIWVLTGDKQETAINIGYSCQLLTDDMDDVLVVDGAALADVERQLDTCVARLDAATAPHSPPTPQSPQSDEPSTVKHSLSVLTYSDEGYGHDSPVIGGGGGGAGSNDRGDAGGAVCQQQPPPLITLAHNEGGDFAGGNDDGQCDDWPSPSSAGAQNDTSDNSGQTGSGGYALVVSGQALIWSLSSRLEQRLVSVACRCRAVVCCRVTPLQKAMVVSLVKKHCKAVTLAIGDGANDVSMIKTADIGVGISGQEGMQAVLASDYSIAQFRFLQRLLLVHGRWSYYRMCKFMRYFFYKNFAFTLSHFWYAYFCGFSAQTVLDPMFIAVFNLFYTSLPVLALAIFDQDVEASSSQLWPRLYTAGRCSLLFNRNSFLRSAAFGFYSSAVMSACVYGTYGDAISSDGYTLSDHPLFGSVLATVLVVVVTAQIAVDTSYWTRYNHICVWGSLLVYLLLHYLYNYAIGGPYVGALTMALRQPCFWLSTALTTVALLAPVLAWRFYCGDVRPTLADRLRWRQLASVRQTRRRRRRLLSRVLRPRGSARRASTVRPRALSLRLGYAFSHQEGFGRLITSGKMMRPRHQQQQQQHQLQERQGNGSAVSLTVCDANT